MAFLAAFLLLFSDVTRNQKLRWAWKWKWWWQKKENDMYSFELLMKKKAKIPSFIQAFGAARREQLVWLQVPSPGQEPARVPAGWLPVEMQVLNIKLLTLTTTGQNRALQLLRLPFLLPFLLLRSPPPSPPGYADIVRMQFWHVLQDPLQDLALDGRSALMLGSTFCQKTSISAWALQACQDLWAFPLVGEESDAILTFPLQSLRDCVNCLVASLAPGGVRPSRWVNIHHTKLVLCPCSIQVTMVWGMGDTLFGLLFLRNGAEKLQGLLAMSTGFPQGHVDTMLITAQQILADILPRVLHSITLLTEPCSRQAGFAGGSEASQVPISLSYN